MTTNSMRPTNKVTVGVATGAAVTIAAWALSEFVGVTIPAQTQGAFQILAVFISQWWISDNA